MKESDLLTAEEKEKILEHLIKTNQAFCFYQGMIIQREDCQTKAKS